VLGYDFFLFVDAETDRDALLTSSDADQEILTDILDAPSMAVDEARQWIDQTGDDHLFFSNEANNRGAVIYRRYDGHYGLLTPSNVGAPSDREPFDSAKETH